MADAKISAFAAAASGLTTMELAVNNAGTSSKLTVFELLRTRLMGRDCAPTNLNNSTNTTSIYSCTIPANWMGSTGVVRTRLLGEYWHSVGAAASINLRIGLSSTTLYQDTTATMTASADSRPVWISFDIVNLGATNSQVLGGKMEIAAPTATTGQGDAATVAPTDVVMRGTAAVDTTSASTLDVFIKHSAASTLITYRHWYGYTELVN